MKRRAFIQAVGGAATATAAWLHASEQRRDLDDVCIYGATSSGVMAAVAAAREGCRVVIVEPSRWLGGMTGGGLCHVDWGRAEAVGGTTRGILKQGRSDPQYRQAFLDLVKRHSITVLYEHRVGTVRREGTTIVSLALDHAPPDRHGCPAPKATTVAARIISARMFIDCSYEGDLMARAGVSYTFGRESKETYGETLAGVRPNLAVYEIDPYVKPGDRRSGLLPLLQDIRPGPLGNADRLTMGYGFRWKFGFEGEGLPIEKPDDYDPRTFELYRRGFQSQVRMDVGRRMRTLGRYEPEGGEIYRPGAGNLSRCLWAPTVFGCNAEYPDGDWPTRARVWKFHQDFLRGLTHFLRTDPNVPPVQKERAMRIALLPGTFDDTGGWPHQLYVREARRMRSAYVVTQKDLEGTTDPEDSVGLASYGVDDWPYATYPCDGKVALSGGEFSMLYLDDRHRGIYKVPYRSITPPPTECNNLLVPVCCSASHIAMTSIRMEPVWMILGESAGVAASLAVELRLPVQDVPYRRLRGKLLALGQRLERPA